MLSKMLIIPMMTLFLTTTNTSLARTTCDDVLEKCAITVEKQKKAISEQKDVIKDQDVHIDTLKKKNKAQEEKIKETSVLSYISNALLLLLILL